MKPRGYLTVALATTLNIVLYAATFGRFIWLEGRVRGGVFRNWIRRFRYRPRRVAYPTTEEEIVNLVRNSTGIRFFGAGHSFNGGVVADDTLVSLDRYRGVIRKDVKNRQVTFKGGTRVREVVKLLREDGLAFRALPSHDAQSIAGILSTDVHGTGSDWGFVSELVVSLKVIDGRGDVHVCHPADALFKAAVGGIGAVGVITEVTVQAVGRFNVEQRVRMSDVTYVEANLDRLLREHKHLSLYIFPFTTRCQINTWDPTGKPRSLLGDCREFVAISADALLATWFGGFMAVTGLLPRLSHRAHGLKRGTNLVLESSKAFNRTIYHVHQELEFAIPFEQTFDACRRYLRLYEEMYPTGMPYTIIEVRFTPAGHDRTLVGAGRGRRSAWLDLLCNDTAGFERYYAAAERLMREIGARPHPGKFCEAIGKDDMARLHGADFAKFLALVGEHDPGGKFSNDFTRRLFG